MADGFTGMIKHDGSGCPFNIGDVVSVIYRDGTASGGIIGSAMLGPRSFYPSRCANGWFWAVNRRPAYASLKDITDYSLIKDGEQVDAIPVNVAEFEFAST